MKDIICIYHGNCADGFGAAWSVNKALDSQYNLEFYPGVYQKAPPSVKGKIVIIVDFSYSPDVVLAMLQDARAILIIDHHKTAIDSFTDYDFKGRKIDMSNWSKTIDFSRFLENLLIDQCENAGPRIYTYFDLNRSGAMMAWNFFHPDEAPPSLIAHIQDRDLWKFYLPRTREIQACIFSHPYDFTVWDFLSEMDPKVLAREGEAIERKHFKDIDELIKVCMRWMNIGGFKVPVASLPYTLTSDAGHKMADETGSDFAACYWDTETTRVFSLRSTESGTDVSEIAKMYGGGGHKHAAGFSVPREHELAKV